MNTVNTVETGDESERPKYIKLTIPRKLHTSFKKACTESGVGMHAKILQLMEDYSNTVNTVKPVKPVDGNEIIDDTVNDPNKVFAVLLEKLEKINQRLDAVENKDGVDSPVEKTTENEQIINEESDRSDSEAVDNNSMNDGKENDISTDNTNSDTSADNQTTQSNLENGQISSEQLSLALAVETEKTEKQENNKTCTFDSAISSANNYQGMEITHETRLSGKQLGQRLNSHEATVWRQLEKVRKGEKSLDDFAEWSTKLDKYNIAWVPDGLNSKKTYYKPQKLTSAELTIPSTSPVMPEGFESKQTLSNDIENITEDTRLNQSQLRKRLEVKSSGTVSAKTKSLTPDDFAKWSRKLDKDNIAWVPVPPKPNLNQERQIRYYYPIF